MDQTLPSLSAQSLYTKLGSAAWPLLIDVRRQARFEADDALIAGAVRRDPEAISAWQHELPHGRPVVVYCVHGHEVSQNAAAALRAAGREAAYLEGGIAEWSEQGLPTRRRSAPNSGKWITRARPKIDRIACPWLVRRFVDPTATFLYVPTEAVFAVAAKTDAIAFDIPGAEPFSHDGDLCSFDAFVKIFGLRDAALDRLAAIVRGADTGHLELAPQSAGLLAVSLGLSAIHADDDHAMLEAGMPVYDALYAWCRSLQHETHNWKPAPV
ncbi:MAG: chromate resistance protein [Telmatospirillum sp.]|nr:chromate resistance protein [Telmatospirillum sp.]